MGVRKESRLRRFSRSPAFNWLIVFLYASIIFYFSSLPAEKVPTTPVSTSWLHLAEYSGFGVVLLRAAKSSSLRNRILVSLLIIALYAASDEVHQYFVLGRVMDFFDWLLDCAGGVLGVFLSEKALKLRV